MPVNIQTIILVGKSRWYALSMKESVKTVHTPDSRREHSETYEDKNKMHLDDAAQEVAWDAAEEFESLKFDKQLAEQWWKEFGSEPSRFFSPEEQEKIASMPSARRIVMLARASLHLSVTPSMALKHFDRFPEDKRAVKSIVLQADGMAHDGITHNLFTLVWPHMHNVLPVDSLRGQRRNGGQYDEIAIRRELAPNFLLSNHQEGGLRLRERFGNAAEAYEKAAARAHELAIQGEEILDPSEIFSGEEYKKLAEERKAELLRACVDDMHFSLVFDETFNSAFTRERVAEDNSRMTSGRRAIPYNPAHSMLFGTKQGSAAYEKSERFYQRQMNSTADIGGYIEEYPHHRLLLVVLKEFQNVNAGADANTDLLTEFWTKNRNPIFGNAVADALSRQNPERAGKRLMEAVQTDTWNPAALASILYRLELGRIGVSKEGVRYLERLYDLGELNDPNFFVNRLTTQGDIGVFDENRTLRGYFNLGDLASPGKIIRAEVLKLTREMLFHRRAIANSDEELFQEALLEEFTAHYFDFYEGEFFAKTGMRFNNLSFREQAWFLHFMHGAREEEKEMGMEVVRAFGEDGLKALLSLEVDRKAGDKILQLAEKGEPLLTERAFRLHARIVNSVEGIETYLRNEFGKESDDASISTIAERLLTRARDCIERASDAVGNEEKTRAVIRELSAIHVGNVQFLSACRVLKEKGELTLGDIRKGG